MPRRDDLESILIIGAGPIIIGQACEFDYSGTQACKALKEEGYRVILVNSNPATIMTDPASADAIYIEPIHWRAIAEIIAKERPSALLPTMGGQTALELRARSGARGRAREIRRRAHRGVARSDRHGRGSRAVPARDERHRPRHARGPASRTTSRKRGKSKRKSASRRSCGRRSRSAAAAAASPTTATSSRTS